MKPAVWLFTGLAFVVAAGCGSGRSPDAAADGATPALPPSTASDVGQEPDSSPESPADTTVGATPQEVESEVREMFGPEGMAEAESEEATWDIPITMNEAVERWLEYFQTDGRRNFSIYLSRSGRYEPMMRAVFRDSRLPEDLVYLSLIESGFSPRAYSRAHAVGLWQFIRSTGGLYGLRVSYWVDERRDPILATKAAAAHLKDLYEEFGSWYLAAAAYNGGATRVRRGIARTGSDDFWTLADRRYLRRETRNYVPKLIAAALIAKQPEHFGFIDIPQSEPLAYDVVRVPDATSLEVIAEAAGVPESDVAELNPQVLRGVTPPGERYSVRVPAGSGQTFAANYATIPPGDRVRWVAHTVRRGETLSRIARIYGVSVSAIRAANNYVNPRRLRIGQRLVIPRAGKLPTRLAAARTSSTRRVEPQRPDGRYITYRVQRGDTLWAIARRYDVTARQLMQWNGLRTTRIYPGDEVRVYVGSSD